MGASKNPDVLSSLKWMLKCPHCGTEIRKPTLVEDKRCDICGWLWGFDWYLMKLREIAEREKK